MGAPFTHPLPSNFPSPGGFHEPPSPVGMASSERKGRSCWGQRVAKWKREWTREGRMKEATCNWKIISKILLIVCPYLVHFRFHNFMGRSGSNKMLAHVIRSLRTVMLRAIIQNELRDKKNGIAGYHWGITIENSEWNWKELSILTLTIDVLKSAPFELEYSLDTTNNVDSKENLNVREFAHFPNHCKQSWRIDDDNVSE